MLNAALEENPKFTGQTHDIDTDLYYYNARYYDSTLGRFLQADSLIANVFQPQTINPYAYVLNNPLKYIDPSGHEPFGGDENLNLNGDSGDAAVSGDGNSGDGTGGTAGENDPNDPIGHPNLDAAMNGSRGGGGDDNGVQQSSLTVGDRGDPMGDDAVFIINIGTGETKDGPGLSSVSFSDHESTISLGQSGTAVVGSVAGVGGGSAAVITGVEGSVGLAVEGVDTGNRLTMIGAGTSMVGAGREVAIAGRDFYQSSPTPIGKGAGLFAIGIGTAMVGLGGLLITEFSGITNLSGINNRRENDVQKERKTK